MEHKEEHHIPEEALKKIRDPHIVRKQVKEGKTFQEILGYNQGDMEKFYTIGYTLFQKQEYRKAADAFIFLTTLNPYVHNYWLGLGMSEHLLGSYQSALLAYAMAILTDMNNPIAHYHSASCYLMTKDKDSALSSLKMAIECCKGVEKFEQLKTQAETAFERIKK